ncbi:MAG: DUF1134 domain-containing protein [Alphaproteobacteria bacterium]
MQLVEIIPMSKTIRLALLAALSALGLSINSAALGAPCTDDDFAAAIDSSGAALRSFNAGALPTLKDKLRQLKDKKGWADAGYEEKVLQSVRDKRTDEYDAKAKDLIVKIDTLGSPPSEQIPDCSKLAELNAAGLELLAVMRAKSAYTLTKLDAAIAEHDKPRVPASKTAGTPSATKPPRKISAKPGVATATPPPPRATAAPAKVPARRQSESWSTKTKPRSGTDVDTAWAPVPPSLPQPTGKTTQGYSIDEVREITQGFFGTISTNLASVIEYAFSKSGRPSAYVLGKEGGGAFLAGVRYGSGTLFMRSGGKEKIYWHGPSLGTDFGAAGSRTMFLIYRLNEPADLYRQFAGVDGSAYFVGGIGITFLKGGKVIMAPIRSGIGLRLGANIGYIRFTPRPTWNPF